MFDMKINESKKALIIKVEGFFTPKEGKNYVETYKMNVNSINPQSYNFIILGEELLTSSPEMVSILENILCMYKNTGFKKYYGTLPRSPLASMQLKKIIVKTELDVTFADNIEDILAVL